MLLLPGYTGSKEDFSPILDPLAADGFRAIAVDLPGQFESEGPDDESDYEPMRLGAVVADVIARSGHRAGRWCCSDIRSAAWSPGAPCCRARRSPG